MIFKTLFKQSTYVIKIILLNIDDLNSIGNIDTIESFLREFEIPLTYYKVDYDSLYPIIKEDLISSDNNLTTDMDLKIAVFLIMSKIYLDNIFKVE